MKKVITYGVYEKENGIKRFRKNIKEALSKNKEWKIINEFIDKGNKNVIKENFLKLCSELLNKKIDVIIVGNPKQFMNVLGTSIDDFFNMLSKRNIEIYFTEYKFSTMDYDWKLKFEILKAISMYKPRNIQRKNSKEIKKKLQIRGDGE